MNKKRIQKLFARMNAVYGGTWSGRYTTSTMLNLAIDEWTTELEPYSDGEIEEAYKLCKQRHTTAPTLPQFAELVKVVHQRKRTSGIPELKPCDPAVAKRHIDEIRSILSRKTTQTAEGDVDASHRHAC